VHPELFEIYGRVAATGEGESFEIEFKPRGIWLTISAFSPAKGYFVAVFDNITERKVMIQALTEAKETLRHHAETLEKTVAARTAKLQDSVEELEHFSYTLSHDLRSPLRAMRGFADLMVLSGCGECRNDGSRDFLQRVIAGADRLDLLIHDALDYRQAASKDLPLVSVNLGSLLGSMLKSYPNLQPMHADISMEGDFPEVLGNEAALTQCFSNLLGNAVKFVAPGVKPRIRIWAEKMKSQDVSNGTHQRICIWIQDNGIGIAPEDQKKLFEIFIRINPDYEGTGIGLALVRKNVDKMGGKVGVESELGKGSRFWIELNSAAHARTEQYLLPLNKG
jgi:signal transduction histidine kinase